MGLSDDLTTRIRAALEGTEIMASELLLLDEDEKASVRNRILVETGTDPKRKGMDLIVAAPTLLAEALARIEGFEAEAEARALGCPPLSEDPIVDAEPFVRSLENGTTELQEALARIGELEAAQPRRMWPPPHEVEPITEEQAKALFESLLDKE